MWLYALSALALAAGLLARWSIRDACQVGRSLISAFLHLMCNMRAIKQPSSSRHSSAVAPTGQPPSCVTLRVFGLNLRSRNSAEAAVRTLFQSLLGSAKALPSLVVSTPRRSRRGRWAVHVSIPTGLAKAIRANQPRLAEAQHTAHVSIYHHRRSQQGKRRMPSAGSAAIHPKRRGADRAGGTAAMAAVAQAGGTPEEPAAGPAPWQPVAAGAGGQHHAGPGGPSGAARTTAVGRAASSGDGGNWHAP